MAGRPEHRRVITAGFTVAWRLSGTRRCIGTWNGTTRTPCPLNAAITAEATDPQCASCGQADPGRRLARDAALGDDDRTYALYLAWFGPELLKIGLTATDRGRDRLLEQGAIAYTLLATGTYSTIRRAEHLVSRAGLARERISNRHKIHAWWNLPPRDNRESAVRDAHDHLREQLVWPNGLHFTGCHPVDQMADFALTEVPESFAEITTVSHDTQIIGDAVSIIGRYLLLRSAAGPLLVDMRRIAGWPVSHAHGDQTANTGLTTWSRPRGDHDDQAVLF